MVCIYREKPGIYRVWFCLILSTHWESSNIPFIDKGANYIYKTDSRQDSVHKL